MYLSWKLEIVASDGLSIDSNTSISKTNTRFTAEKSLIADLASGLVIAHLRYILVKNECERVRKGTESTSIVANMLYTRMSKAYGNIPVFTFMPQY